MHKVFDKKKKKDAIKMRETVTLRRVTQVRHSHLASSNSPTVNYVLAHVVKQFLRFREIRSSDHEGQKGIPRSIDTLKDILKNSWIWYGCLSKINEGVTFVV